jgi:hypothetical protein
LSSAHFQTLREEKSVPPRPNLKQKTKDKAKQGRKGSPLHSEREVKVFSKVLPFARVSVVPQIPIVAIPDAVPVAGHDLYGKGAQKRVPVK